jgi:hypothetical protein
MQYMKNDNENDKIIQLSLGMLSNLYHLKKIHLMSFDGLFLNFFYLLD